MDTMTKWMIGIGVFAGVIMLRAHLHKFIVAEGFVGLLYRHGKYLRGLLVGRHRLFGNGYEMKLVNVQKAQLTVPGQEVLTADNIGIKVSAVLTYRVTDAAKAMHEVRDCYGAAYLAVQLALRDAMAVLTSETLLEKRADVRGDLLARVKPALTAIGMEALGVEVKDVMLPADLRKAFTDVIKARKEGLAMLERARGESAAIRNLANAARVLENNPALMNLRVLQSIDEAKAGNTLVMGTGIGLVPMNGKNGK